MIKIIWNWLAWKFYQCNAKKLLAMSTEVVQCMDSRQKLAYVMNAVQVGSRIWTGPLSNLICPQVLILDVKRFVEWPSKPICININDKGDVFKAIAWDKLPKGFSPDYLTPANRELAYAFWSLTRMLAIVYPHHGFKRDVWATGKCDDSEALTRIATSAVASVAAAYGHEKGVRSYGKRYREMIDYRRELK